MNVRFIKSNEKKDIVGELKTQFGIEDIPYLLIETGKEKIRGFSGSLSKDEIMKLGEEVKIEIVGVYLLKHEHDYRLSFDAALLFSEQIKSNILEINEEQFYKWIRGYDLETNALQGTYVVKYDGCFIGCGKSNGKILFNYVPKDRRVRRQ